MAKTMFSWEFPKGQARFLWEIDYDKNSRLDGKLHIHRDCWTAAQNNPDEARIYFLNESCEYAWEVSNIKLTRKYVCPQCKMVLKDLPAYDAHRCTDNPDFVKQIKHEAKVNSNAAIKRQQREDEGLL